MEAAQIVLHQVIIMFLLILIGIILIKRNIVNKNSLKDLSNILLYVVVPALLIRAYNKKIQKEELIGLGISFILSISFHILAIILAKIFIKKRNNENYIIDRLGVVYSNCGFMAFPILNVALGDKGIFYGASFVAMFNVFIWSNGVKSLEESKKFSVKKAIINPGCIAAGLGIITYIMQISYPSVVTDTMDFLADLNTPLAMIAVGCMLSDVKWKEVLKDITLYKIVFIRNIIIPVIFLLILSALHISNISKTVRTVCIAIVLCASCPTANSISLIPKSLGFDGSRGAKIIAFTTILSIITLPLITYTALKLL